VGTAVNVSATRINATQVNVTVPALPAGAYAMSVSFDSSVYSATTATFDVYSTAARLFIAAFYLISLASRQPDAVRRVSVAWAADNR
jgi:hypothetical protein